MNDNKGQASKRWCYAGWVNEYVVTAMSKVNSYRCVYPNKTMYFNPITNAPFRKISNSAQCGRFALIL